MDESLAEHVRTLYATSPAEFVAARNALAKVAKQQGRRDDAAAIDALRRPSWIDGALNRVSLDEPALVAEFVEAARSARLIQQADAEGRRTESLPDALRAVRAAQSRLAAAGNAALVELGRKPDLPGVTARLGQVGSAAVELDLLLRAVLGLEHDGLVAGFRSTVDAGGRAAVDAVDAVDADADADRATRQRNIDAATRAARATEKDAQVAATAARRATERRDRATGAVEAAEAAVRDAELALERARRELAEHETRATDAVRAADEAARAASDATAHLDDLLG